LKLLPPGLGGIPFVRQRIDVLQQSFLFARERGRRSLTAVRQAATQRGTGILRGVAMNDVEVNIIVHGLTTVAIAGIGIWGVVRLINGPIADAISHRLQRPPHSQPGADAESRNELRAELDALQERVDFVERALTSGRPGAGLPPAQPSGVRSELAKPRVRTPPDP
jgi:hypothetical protein